MCGSKGSPPQPQAASTAQQGTTSSTGTGTSTTAPSPFAAALYQQYLGGPAQEVLNTPMTAEQLNAASNLYSLGLQAGTFDPSQIANIESPYIQDVVNKTQAQFNEANQIQNRDLIGSSIKAGNAFGGDRMGVASAELARQQQLAQAPVIAGLYQSGYGQALDEYNKLKSMGLSGAGAAVTGANIPAAYKPQLASWYASQLQGLGPLLGGTTQQAQATQGAYTGYYTPPQPNPWIQGAGLALTGAGMFMPQGSSSPWGTSTPALSNRGGLVHLQSGGTTNRPFVLDVPNYFASGELKLAPVNYGSNMNLAAMNAPSISGGGGGGGSGGTGGAGNTMSQIGSLLGSAGAMKGLSSIGSSLFGGSGNYFGGSPGAQWVAAGQGQGPWAPVGSAETGVGPELGAWTEQGPELGAWTDAGPSLVGDVGPELGAWATPAAEEGGSFLADIGLGGLGDWLGGAFGATSEALGGGFLGDLGAGALALFGLEHGGLVPVPHYQGAGTIRPPIFDSGETVPGLGGITGGLNMPRAQPASLTDTSGDDEDRDDTARVEPASLGIRQGMSGLGLKIPGFRQERAEKAAAPAAIPLAAYVGERPNLPPPTWAEQWATNPLTQAGLAMMRYRSPNVFGGIGAGLEGAASALQQARAAKVQQSQLDEKPQVMTIGGRMFVKQGGKYIDLKMDDPNAPKKEETAAEERERLGLPNPKVGYQWKKNPQTGEWEQVVIAGGPESDEAKKRALRQKMEEEGAKFNRPPAGTVPTPSGAVPASSAGRLFRHAALYEDEDTPFDYIKDEGGLPYDYSKGAPGEIAKGDVVPKPAEVGGYSTKSLQTDIENWLNDGTLPKFQGTKRDTAAAQAHEAYIKTIKNYGNAIAAARGLTSEDIADMQYKGKRGGPLRFALGADGRTTVALGTAMRHLETLRELYAAWDAQSGQFRLSNKVLASIAREFGNAAVTNIETAASIIGPELVKAIGVAGAGTEADRSEMKHNFSLEGTPEQRAGAVLTAEKLLSGQLAGKRKQADAAGMKEKDFIKLIGEDEYKALQNVDKKYGAPAEKTEAPKVAPGKTIGEKKEFDLPGGGKAWGVWDGKNWRPAGGAI